MRRTIRAIVLAASCTATVYGQGAPAPAKALPFSAAEFFTAIVRSLAQVDTAIRAVNGAAERPSIVERMTSLKVAKSETNIALLRLKQITAVPNEDGKAGIEAMASAFEMIQTSLQLQVAGYERLDSATKVEDLAGLRSGMSDAAALYQGSTKLLFDAIGVVFLSTMVADPADPDNKTVLDMTEADRVSVMKLLESTFGPRVKNVKAADTGAMQTAGLLYRGLLSQRARPKNQAD